MSKICDFGGNQLRKLSTMSSYPNPQLQSINQNYDYPIIRI